MKEMILVCYLYLIIFRAEYGEKTVQKLNLRIDTIISDLVVERSKTQNVNDQLDETFELFVNN
jgi:hypothetical protein